MTTKDEALAAVERLAHDACAVGEYAQTSDDYHALRAYIAESEAVVEAQERVVEMARRSIGASALTGEMPTAVWKQQLRYALAALDRERGGSDG